jgi:hypothetical protein
VRCCYCGFRRQGGVFCSRCGLHTYEAWLIDRRATIKLYLACVALYLVLIALCRCDAGGGRADMINGLLWREPEKISYAFADQGTTGFAVLKRRSLIVVRENLPNESRVGGSTL